MTSIMDDDEVLSFVREKGGSARFITSVCAGALVLGSAGLVTSYKSACQRLMRDMLSSFGAVPVDKRVVGRGSQDQRAGGINVSAAVWPAED